MAETAVKTALEQTSGKRPNITLLNIQVIAQILALVSVAGYFLYKNAAGWTDVTMSLDIVTQRVHDPADRTKDILGVTVKLKNGNTGKIRLSDAVATIAYEATTLEKELEGIVRYEIDEGKVVPGQEATRSPSRTGLGPNQEILLSTYERVPTGATCLIDVTILAKRSLKTVLREARSAAVSLPIE
jgi:hypothetical protein